MQTIESAKGNEEKGESPFGAERDKPTLYIRTISGGGGGGWGGGGGGVCLGKAGGGGGGGGGWGGGG